MATWGEIAFHIRNNYEVHEEKPELIRILLYFSNGRSQFVLLWRELAGGGPDEWLTIESPVGELGSIDLGPIVAALGTTVCGGLATRGSMVIIRHSEVLTTVDIRELERPLIMVAAMADKFEQQASKNDKF